jgi:hypothetical protein
VIDKELSSFFIFARRRESEPEPEKQGCEIEHGNRDPGRHVFAVGVPALGQSIEQQGIERAKGCAAGAEPCTGNDRGHGPGYWKHDVNGAVIYATGVILKRNVTLIELSRAEKDVFPLPHGSFEARFHGLFSVRIIAAPALRRGP